MIDRRAMLGAPCLLALAGQARAKAEAAGEQSAPPPADPLDRLAAIATENRYRLTFENERFSGPGWDFLTTEGRASKFFLLGEEHGIAENPKLAAALFRDLASVGYDTLAIETSPLMSGALDAAASGGLTGLRELLADPRAQAAFFGMREEAEMLAAVRAAGPAGRPVLWGLDYDVAADRLAIARLKSFPKPAAAEVALTTLETASTAAWAQYGATRGPQFIFNFSGDPALVRAVRDAWPDPPAEARWLLEVEEATLEINKLYGSGRGYASNSARADLNRRNLLRYWRAAKAEGRTPRVMFKFGANHMTRGLTSTEVFDLGTLAPELAAIEGGAAFHLLVLPGAGSRTAVFDPSAWSYRTGDPRSSYMAGLEPLTDQALKDVFTVIDLRPLRPLVGGGQASTVHRELARLVHGFDAVAILAGSTPSANL